MCRISTHKLGSASTICTGDGHKWLSHVVNSMMGFSKAEVKTRARREGWEKAARSLAEGETDSMENGPDESDRS
eukprot:scaffold327780_cov61-Tisochrysis_lutea.AAC.5